MLSLHLSASQKVLPKRVLRGAVYDSRDCLATLADLNRLWQVPFNFGAKDAQAAELEVAKIVVHGVIPFWIIILDNTAFFGYGDPRRR